MDDLGIFLILAADVHTDLHMAALDLMIQCLADIMQQTGTACHGHIHTHLACQQAGHPCHLHAVGQGVLAKAGAVLQPADQLDQVRVQTMDAQLHHGALALALHLQLQFVAALSTVSSMRAGWMRPSPDQAFQRHAGHLAAGLVEGGQGDGLRGIVDDQSTPVAVSSARMLRPSRPMMRPFISSLGSGTTLTVVSLQWSAAQRLTA